MLPLILLVAALQAATTPAQRVPRAAISGRITDKDTNRPIPRALVSLQANGAPDARQTITDADGRYAFPDLAPGDYALWAGPGELVATWLSHAYGDGAVVLPGERPPRRVSLKAGETRADLDIALTRALAIEGRVLHAWDEPVADAAVTVTRPDDRPVLVMPAYSDDRGEYRIFGLAPGRYRVCAEPNRSFPSPSDTGSKAVRTCYLAAISESSAADVLLEDADAAGIDIRVQRAGTYSASGTVLGTDGVPVDGAIVTASSDTHANGAQATTRNGQFTLTGLVPGRYRVRASIGGREYRDDPRPPAREREWGYTSIAVDSGEISNLVVTVAKPQRVSGRVLFEGPRPSGALHMTVQMGAPPDLWDVFALRPPVGAVDDRLAFEVGELYRVRASAHVHQKPDCYHQRQVHLVLQPNSHKRGQPHYLRRA